MDFLSESQMKLINDFKERVKQSEKRFSETLHETEITIGPSTPGLMPYIGMNDEVSRLSEAKYGKYDTGSNEIMIQDMSPQKATPPQKHLSTFIFNESQSGTHSDEQRLDTFDPQRNVSSFPQNAQKVGKGRYDVIVSRESQDLIDQKGNMHRPVSFSGASNPLRDSMTTKSNYIQSSQASNHDPVDEAYRREIGVQDTEQTEEGRERIVEEGQQEDEEEEHHENEGEYEQREHENSYFDHQRQYQMMYGGSLHSYPIDERQSMSGQESTTMFYGNKLDEYLRSQEKTQSSFAFERPTRGFERGERGERIEGTDHYFYHMDDEKRRLKVPSIRYFEDGHVSPLKKKIIEDKYREIRNYSSVEKERQDPYEERERGILSHQDQNTSGSFHHQNRLALNTQPLKQKRPVGTPKKGLSSTTTKSLKTQKSVKSMTNKRQNIENIRGKENTMKKPKERKTGGERGRPQTSVPPTRKTENIKLRPLTRSPHPSGTAKSVKKDTAHHHQEEPENERRELAKDILRKCRLGTIDQNQFITLLEDHMHVSANFFERLKDLANK